MLSVLSLGGSIVAPETADPEFLAQFRALVLKYLQEDPSHKLIMVVGGGGPARSYQNACKAVTPEASAQSLDWIGIMATRLNAQLVKTIFHDYCPQEVVTDPSAVELFSGRVLVAAGWKPGFSTDFDAVVLAERFGADKVVNLSNIAKVFTADPKLDPSARPLDDVTWAEFRKIVGDEWVPGKNLPFDPVATKRAAELGLTVICAAGRDLDNLDKLLHGQAFNGTTIHK
jgi:uridylate kinase